jgi:hypothetical protein
MPSHSTAQQALMGQAYAIKLGELRPSDLKPEYRKEIMRLSRSLSKKQLKAYASTKHKDLPHHVDEDKNPLEPVGSAEMPNFSPRGPGKIIPFLDTDSKKKKKGGKNLQNLKDYRDWVSEK